MESLLQVITQAEVQRTVDSSGLTGFRRIDCAQMCHESWLHEASAHFIYLGGREDSKDRLFVWISIWFDDSQQYAFPTRHTVHVIGVSKTIKSSPGVINELTFEACQACSSYHYQPQLKRLNSRWLSSTITRRLYTP